MLLEEIQEPYVDPFAERTVLSSIFQHGQDAYIDVDVFVKPNMFNVEINQILFSCVQAHFGAGETRPLDYATLMAVARRKGFYDILNEEDATNHIRALYRSPVALESALPESAKLLKLHAGREFDEILRAARKDLRKMTGDETLAAILAMVEDPINEFIGSFDNSKTEGPAHIAEDAEQWLEHVIANPCENLGVPSPWPKWNEQLGGGFRPKSVALLGARMKVGKAGTLDSLVYTPNGPKRMGDMAVGDVVSTPDGKTAIVDGVYPQGTRDTYRVVFADGDSVEVDGEHLWKVTHRRKKTPEIRTTNELRKTLTSPNKAMKRGFIHNWHVELPESCFYNHREPLIDPYLLGYLVGNGNLTQRSINLSVPDAETVDRLNGILTGGYRLRFHENCKNGIDYTLTNSLRDENPYMKALEEYGLKGKDSHGKFIPDEIKYNSVDVRWRFLNGWLDADGGASLNDSNTSNIEGSTVSRRLAYDLKELIQSLGGLCSVKPRITKCDGKSFDSFRLHIRFNNASRCFVLKRKADLIRDRTKGPLRRLISDIEYVGKKPTQCIRVDSPDHLYMTDHHIVTHNTHAADNICLHAAKMGIPTLNVDTEMTRDQHLARILANITNIDSRKIERGDVTPEEAESLRKGLAWLKTIPYYYESVISKPFEQQIASMRRWCTKHVPLGENGERTPSLILYDYLQVIEESELTSNANESQKLGFMMMALIRLADKMASSVVSLIQLNRDGDDKESSTVIFGSDRPAMKCASFTILKRKSEAEIKDDGRENGTHKLVNKLSRFGEGGEGNYISLIFNGATSRIVEGKTYIELRRERGTRTSDEDTFERPKTRKKPKSPPEPAELAQHPF